MSYILDGSTIKAPNRLNEENSTQTAEQRPLSGRYTRDLFGDNKRIWILDYVNCKKADYDTIKTIYDAYLSSGTAVTWQSTEANYTFAETSVHIEVLEREFSVKGSSYLSDFTVILTEA